MLNPWQIKVTVLRNVLLASTLCPLLAACGGPSVRGDPLPATPALSLSAGKVLAAIGVKPQMENGCGADDAVWQDRRVAFGLTNMLAESFYQYFGQKSGSRLGDGAIVTKLFVLRAGFFQAVPLGYRLRHAFDQMLIEGAPLEAGHGKP